LMKFSVKKNRSFREFFFAIEDTSICLRGLKLRAMNLSGPRISREASV
jgi:hypothetical protein